MKFPSVKIPSTLSKLSPAITSVVGTKPSLGMALKLGAMATPLGLTAVVGTLAVKEIIEHKDQIGSTLGKLGSTVKTDAKVAVTTIGNGAKTVVKGVSSGLETLLMPVMVVGGIVLAIMVLK